MIYSSFSLFLSLLSLFFVIFTFIVNLGFAFKIVSNEFMINDLRKLLEAIEELKGDLLKKGNNSKVKDELEKDNKVDDRQQKVINFTKVLRKTKKVLIKAKREFEEVSDLTKELKDVNEKLKDDVKNTVKKLKKINDLIEELKQVEDFTEELIEVSRHLDKLDKLLELNKININKEEPEEVNVNKGGLQEIIIGVLKEDNKFTEEIVEKFARELSNIKELMKGLREVLEFKKQLYDLFKGLKEKELSSEEELINELEKLNNFKKELEMFNINEEKEDFSDHAEFTAGYVKEDEIRETTEELIEEGQLEKKYRKFSRWSRDNQPILVILTILAGVDLSYIGLFGSPNLNFNVKLSHAAENSLFWGNVTNVFVEDISAILIKVCKLY
jgi:hypothetical protein